MKKMHALVVGATGATGQEIVKFLLKDASFNKVSIFVRKKTNLRHKKLIIHKINFSKINEYQGLLKGDVLFSCLGTTRKAAGNKKNQYLVDYTYQYEFAVFASKNKVGCYSLISSVGANKNSIFFYPKIKGALEEAVKNLNFNKIQIFRPPSLIRQTDLIRSSEKKSIKFVQILNKFGFLKSFKPLPVEFLAKKMVEESLLNKKTCVKTYKPEECY
ncbi:MAG: semialdehyde dehydrogenase [Flavobacteriales bacterium]|nr:semialdehyde dehydrogenase [Flavobacteriales bacterium]|tara:strand:- start:297 stop:944 length:648 start_codon:yes stop_codon:yes gene_type:complete